MLGAWKRTIETSIFQVIGIRIVLQQLWMSPSGETAERTTPQGGVVRRRPTHESELVQASGNHQMT